MQHGFSVWVKTLSADDQTAFAEELPKIERLLSQAKQATPQAMRATSITRYTATETKRKLAVAMLACAEACRESHPEDAAALCALLKVSIKGKLPFERAELQRFLEFLAGCSEIDPKLMPVDEVIGQIERELAGQAAPQEWRPCLETIHQSITRSLTKPTKSSESLLARIQNLGEDSITPRLKPDEGWADLLRQDVAAMPKVKRQSWESLLSQAAAVVPEPPAVDWDISLEDLPMLGLEMDAYWAEHDRRFFARGPATSWQERIEKLIAEVGSEDFESHRLKWFQAIPDSKPGALSQFSVNRELLRGLIWTSEHTGQPALTKALRVAAAFFFKGNSPLGRTTVRILAHIRSANGLEELAHLRNQVRSESQIRLIDAARALLAEKSGVSAAELQDLPLPDSGFSTLGKRIETLAGFRAELSVVDSGTAELRWFKPNGQEQKSVPAIVKREHAGELRGLKTAVKEVHSTLAAAKDRLESAPLEQRSWTSADWRKRYFDHPVVGTLARRLIWDISHHKSDQAVAFDGQALVNLQGQTVELSPEARISVWHPIHATANDVLAWRERLMAQEVRQPFKQAHREVYLLTDAERDTEVYSNRFAAHILKQSQFRALAKARGWNSDYLGPWDSGSEGKAKRELPEWNLRAEYWVSGTSDEHAEAGGYFYIATDQVRFYRLDAPDPLPLRDVPPLPFSEVMRDVDLFVGVCSVGNDPHWHDGGPDGRYADYWESYSFGELSATAATRKTVLQRIVPCLKIADRCSFGDRFLIVQGDLRRYRIHLGSGNILMEPNNQYLCIVPAQGTKTDQDFFLPFEGDSRLSVILSKALLLADDTSIKDKSITSQISRSAK